MDLSSTRSLSRGPRLQHAARKASEQLCGCDCGTRIRLCQGARTGLPCSRNVHIGCRQLATRGEARTTRPAAKANIDSVGGSPSPEEKAARRMAWKSKTRQAYITGRHIAFAPFGRDFAGNCAPHVSGQGWRSLSSAAQRQHASSAPSRRGLQASALSYFPHTRR